MAVSNVDRDPKYMKEMWGTTKLVTDYTGQRVLQEVMYDSEKKNHSSSQELFEDSVDNEFNYGIEPTYKLNKGQKVL